MDLSEIQGRVGNAAIAGGTPMAVTGGSEVFEDKNLSDFELDEVSIKIADILSQI